MVARKLKKVGGDFAPAIALKKGEKVCGIYKEMREVEQDKGEPRKVYIIAVEGKFKDFDGAEHTGDGTLWGSGLLNWFMSKVKTDTYVEVTYEGTEPYKFGKKTVDSHKYSVETE